MDIELSWFVQALTERVRAKHALFAAYKVLLTTREFEQD
jgi:hypothetical protein